MDKIYHFIPNCWSIEGLKSESYSRNRDVWSEILEGSVVVALIEGAIVMDVLSREANYLIALWRSCGGWEITVSTPSCVEVN